MNESAAYFQKLGDGQAYSDLFDDAEFGEASHNANNAVKKLAEVLASWVQSGYAFESTPKQV